MPPPLLRLQSSLPNLVAGPGVHLQDQLEKSPSRVHAYPLDVTVRSYRVLSVVLVVTAVIVGIMATCANAGIRLYTFDSAEKDDEQLKSLLDDYNSKSGGITNAVGKAIEMVLQAVIAVATLSFAAEWTLNDRLWYGKYAPLVVVAVLGYLISSGLSALNVQVTSDRVAFRLTNQDMVQTALNNTIVADDGVLMPGWNKSMSEMTEGNSVLNTVFRSFIFPFDASSDRRCKTTDDPYSHTFVHFGYASRGWHSRATDIPSAAQTVQFRLDADDLDDDLLPMEEATALNLFVDLLEFPFNNWRGTLGVGFQRGTNTSDLNWKFSSNLSATSFSVGELLNLTKPTRGKANYLQATTRMLRSMLNSSEETMLLPHSHVKYSRYPISNNVNFDSITLEVAVPVQYFFTAAYGCYRNGCLHRQYKFRGGQRFRQNVKASSICLNKDGTEESRYYQDNLHRTSCASMSNSSLRVSSGGRRIEGEECTFTPPEDTSPGTLNTTNARQVYSVTIGRLSWQLEDLSALYDAQCVAESCIGIHALVNPSDPNSSHLLLAESAIPLQHLNRDEGYGFPTDIVEIIDPTSYTDDLVLPRMFDKLNPDAEQMKELAGENCSVENEIALDRAIKNHILLENSHQAACIGAFHFLFQSAVEHEQLDVVKTDNSSSSSGTSQGIRLQLDGNRYHMALRASIPFVSIVLSVVGCAILLLVGIASVCYRSQSSSTIRDMADARVVAVAMTNSGQFPPWLLMMTLEHQQAPVPLEHFQISSVELVQQTEDTGAAPAPEAPLTGRETPSPSSKSTLEANMA